MALSRKVGCVVAAWLGAAGCGGGSGPAAGEEGSRCGTGSDCNDGLVCVDGVCRRTERPDGGDDADVVEVGPEAEAGCPPARVCGDTCCAEGEVCGGGLCCAPADLCGGVCCGPDRVCDDDRCRLACDEDRVACGVGDEAVCCAVGAICYLGECLEPGEECSRSGDCPDGYYCEPTLGRCLPRAGGEPCEYRPETGPFEMTVEWSWDGDPEVLPSHYQVMMAPMVASLTDDDGDGRIGAEDVPEVVFSTFQGNDYWGNGVLRAISGADGSRVWPAADPGYRTTPGGEIAVADVDPTSPGPEVMACSASARASGTEPARAGHLLIVAADGTLLRRFDTAPNDVPCGFDAPAVGDLDGDGVPEIVVRWLVAHGDGTVVRRVREAPGTTGPYNALADVDGDDNLELVGAQGAYRADGTAVWERFEDAPGRPALPVGAVALADLDLDGDPELVVVANGNHSIQALDAATGNDVWGPYDINPPEMAAEVAANGNPSGGGPPTIGNFDDDPNPEVAFAGGFAYVVFDHDGSRLWWFRTRDLSSRVTGSSLFDFEGDGVAEVLYNDELDFRVFRGPDGTVLLERCNTSGTLREFPIVADADGDGQAEIVLMQNNYSSALTCRDGTPNGHGIKLLGHPRGQWVRTRRIFNQHTYHVTNVEEDGTVPVHETRHWTAPRLNRFRLNVQPEGVFDAPDAVLADLAAGLHDCPASIALSVRVVNRGAAGIPAGLPVTFYRLDGTDRIRLGRVVTTRALLPGESERVELNPAFVPPAGGESDLYRFTAVVNDPDDEPLPTFNECRPGNNESEILEAGCPWLG
ncbi:MAG: VCBS repeat-containing protein [Deltaproteobacteria bacterium]|nr:VCBS repeat-containing protein [Deltaproteobacteria bacterium]